MAARGRVARAVRPDATTGDERVRERTRVLRTVADSVHDEEGRPLEVIGTTQEITGLAAICDSCSGARSVIEWLAGTLRCRGTTAISESSLRPGLAELGGGTANELRGWELQLIRSLASRGGAGAAIDN